MAFDTEKFRLRRFVDKLSALGEVEEHSAPVPFGALAGRVENATKLAHFHAVGPERFEMVAGVNAGPERLAAAFGVGEKQILTEYIRRLQQKQEVVEIPSADAPVHQVILTGEQIDLTRLPFYLQHEFDGAPYISAALDFTVDPATKKPNVGCRRLMLKSRTTLRSNLTQPSDLRRIYLGCVERQEPLPASFVIGVHPCDFLAATSQAPFDEFELIARIRGETLPMVRGVTNNIPVPADAELVIEGYFDKAGYSEIEGPYGELYSLYGPMHPDPIFHVTAITMRRDVLHQTLLHGGPNSARTDAANLSGLNFSVMVWRAVKEAGIDITDVYVSPAGTGLHHARIAIRQKEDGQARKAIAAVMKLPLVKHIIVTDDDVDLRSSDAMDLAFVTRFRADRDIVTESGHFTLSMDPTRENGKMVKAGFDLTQPFGAPDIIENRISQTPSLKLNPRWQNVQQALESGPKHFIELMEGIGTDDGRTLTLELDQLQHDGILGRGNNGEWLLKPRG
ncbi:MAG TPA: UbiD family decarboxylase [Stellaceae bacterium]